MRRGFTRYVYACFFSLTDKLYRLGGDIGSLTIGQGVVRPPSEEAASRLAMFYLPLILEITTDVRNPYA